MIGHMLFRRGADGLLRKCVSEVQVPSILAACHNSLCGGHFSRQLTGYKILRACVVFCLLCLKMLIII